MRLYKIDNGTAAPSIIIDLAAIIAISELVFDWRKATFSVYTQSHEFKYTKWSYECEEGEEITAEQYVDIANKIHDDLVTAWKQYLDTAYKQI